ncbi:MAG: hypothetical protein U0638_04120 [Phycisphaerales bacterium]
MSVAAAAPRRRPPSTGLTLPLLAALIVGVIASFGVAIVGTLLTEPLASAPTESGPYVTEPDGTMKLARGWIWPAPKEWGEPDQYQRQGNWLTTLEMAATSKPVESPSDPSIDTSVRSKSQLFRPSAGFQQRFSCGWPAAVFDVRDAVDGRILSHTFTFAAWRFEYREPGPTLLVYPSARQGSGPVRFPKSMPTRVYWPGLAFNTLFFGVMFLVMFILPGRAKIARRRRLGLCLACGYDLAGLAMCPECGLAAGDEKPAHSAATPSPVP